LRLVLIAICATGLLLVLGSRPSEAQYTLSAYPYCTSTDSIYVIWTTYDPAADPTDHPEWIGYDVVRRALPGCSEYTRVNDEIIPRLAGQTHTRYFGEPTPAHGVLFEYRVRAVDANRQQVFLPGFCAPCDVYPTCPDLSAPAAVGTLVDETTWLRVIPCPGTCYPSPYIEPGAFADELRRYAGTGTSLAFFGTLSCGSVEGCALQLDHWALTSCVTPAFRRSWGRIKTSYR